MKNTSNIEEAFILEHKHEFMKIYASLFNRYAQVLIDNNHSLEALLKIAYTDIEDITGKIKETNNFTCSSGCSFCCYGDIFLSPIEAELVKASLSKPKTTVDKELLARQKKTPYHKRKYADKRCSLLNENEDCSIYEYRPIICRIWNSTSDPSKCNLSGGKQTAATVSSLHYYAIAGILGQLSIDLLKGTDNVNLVDIL